MGYSRRSFLKHASAAVTAAGLFGKAPGPWLWAAKPADLLPEPDEALLRELALAAMDAARSAGASFADIRIGVGRSVRLTTELSGSGQFRRMYPSINMMNQYSIRALVDGGWGFAYGQTPTPDAVADAARTAVAGARLHRPRGRHRIELAPVPEGVTGEWETEIEQDPFTVRLYEQRQLMEDVLGVVPEEIPPGVQLSYGFMALGWRKGTIVFASTDGTLLTQRLFAAMPAGAVFVTAQDERGVAGADVLAVRPDDVREPDPEARNVVPARNSGSAGLETLRSGPYGYEALGDVETLTTDMREAVARAAKQARETRGPIIPAEVGRYDIVFGSTAVSDLLLTTVATAVDLRRALGYEANRAGTSFAAPPSDMLGKYQVASELITVRGDRTQPKGAATVGWDDEGVEPRAYTFIEDGMITDYHTDRQTAMELAEWYRSRHEPVRPQGLARGVGPLLPVPRLPNLTMTPGENATTVDDLIAGTDRGFYVQACDGASDQQVLNTQMAAGHPVVRRIKNGKLGEYVRDFAFQFITPGFWKGVDGIGDGTTAVARNVDTGIPGHIMDLFPFSTVQTVPMRVRGVNVLNTGRTG